MAGFWSMVGLVFKSIFTAGETVENGSASVDGPDERVEPCLYAVAHFVPEDPSGTPLPDQVGDWVKRTLSDIPDTAPLSLGRHFTISTDIADAFQAVREAHAGVLNLARRQDATAVFWGQTNPVNGLLEVHFSNDMLVSPLYELLLPLVHTFRQPQHKDTAAALHILLTCELLARARGRDLRALQVARLASHLDDLQERINNGENFADVGQGVTTAYAFGAVMLAETGERSYCLSAIRAIEPIVRQFLTLVTETPKDSKTIKKPTGLLNERVVQQETVETISKTEDMLRGVADLSLIDPERSAIMALYGTLLNWSMVSNMNARSGATAIGVWKLLERRFELMAGTPVSRAIAIGKLGEATMIHAKEIDDIEMAETASGHYRRALGLVNAKAHTVLYAQIAYGLAESVVAQSTIGSVGVVAEQVIPVFQAALKVCSRRDHPYLWGRAMFALGSVQFSLGAAEKDLKTISHARMNFSQAYDAFDEAAARGAARAASGSFTRAENMMHQLSQRQAVIDATGGAGEAKAS
ncbi:hypothetical protein SAMN02744133_101206 [Thalassospira xiamenensis M-5 = DSM 17429]|uniref:Uncharacterized protein n=1 Tax=Thalassospira xiamenensis M-5 = DSM 17429 TaxID=1123366 RepID=A0AB72UHZ8_9PROT|nr:hypothetical protein [Thalassospira xiamenensis]AJD53878.1 hypothetical protein TH3_18880 [Thalassospira xiamenensis M-5 = DSM 17429]SIS56888.1 hypothetical protein SAMN02744133_101206 [Thalassospira xiamenensis M-5 = DSM 17429]